MPKLTTITELGSYLTSVQDIYCFYWVIPFDSAVESPSTDLSYEVQIDTTANFATVNLQTITETTAYTYYNGDVIKAFAVQLPKRQQDQDYTYYWRVRINAVDFITDWSETQSTVVKQNYTKMVADAMLEDLADQYTYSKEANTTNTYVIFRTFARLLDLLKFEAVLTKDDTCIDLARDEALEQNFGALIEFYKSATQSMPEYRGVLKRIYNTFLQYSGTEQGIKDIVSIFTGEPPTIVNNAREQGWTLGQNYIYDPDYPNQTPPIILYDRNTKGFGWTLYVYNSWGSTLDTERLETIVKRIMPAVSKVDIEYPTHQHVSILFNKQSDWQTCIQDTVDITTRTDKVRIDYVGFFYNQGILTTPVIDCGSTIDSWGTFEPVATLHGQTIQYQLTSSINGAVWSDWETLEANKIPETTPVRRYVRLKAILLSGASYSTPELESLRLNYVRSPGTSRPNIYDIVLIAEDTTIYNITPPFHWSNDYGSTPNRGRWGAAQWS